MTGDLQLLEGFIDDKKQSDPAALAFVMGHWITSDTK